MNKTRTITLTFKPAVGVSKATYIVNKVTDSVEYAPGASLTKIEVDSLCRAAAWKVTITG